MAPSSSLERPGTLNPAQRAILLGIARASIRHGLAHDRPLPLDLAALPPELTAERAAFVTLHNQGHLRGCIGRTSACLPLAEDVAALAFAAAFRDPRFPPVTLGEFDDLAIELSLLSLPQPMSFGSEADLLAQLVPGVDGLIIQAPGHQGVFLPTVWASLPEPAEFLLRLKLKAGLAPKFPATEMNALRFHTESIREGGGPEQN
jgi:hypothetical protein